LIPHEIKNLIFDLGGVIIGLDPAKTHNSFALLSGLQVHELRDKILSQSFFNEYEKGLLTTIEFRAKIRSCLNLEITDQQIDDAWNAMLLDIPKEKFELLQRLKLKYQVFLLSNTNEIHLQAVNEIVLKSSGKPSLDHHFHKAFYSHLLHMRKPDQEIFSYVLKECNLTPSQTLFVDDIVENIRGAQSLGIQSIQITSPEMILSLFQ